MCIKNFVYVKCNIFKELTYRNKHYRLYFLSKCLVYQLIFSKLLSKQVQVNYLFKQKKYYITFCYLYYMDKYS